MRCYSSMCHTQHALTKLVNRESFSWASVIKGYVGDGNLSQALCLYKEMRYEFTVHPDASVYAILLKACTKLKDLDLGQQLHEDISAANLLANDSYISSGLVNMYAKCNSLAAAQEVFDKLPTHDVVSWTALISGYVEHGHGEEALACLECLQQEGICPNIYTYVCSLKACSCIRAIDKGRHLHAEIVEKGWEREDVPGNMLVDFYAKFGDVSSAHEVFDCLTCPDVISWTALIGGYAEYEHPQEALSLFEQMDGKGISPNSFTCVCTLKACANMGATIKGQDIHSQVCSMGLETELLVGTALVNMYGKCGLLADAQCIFDKILIRDAVLWTALIGGYTEHGYGEEALCQYKEMQLQVYDSNSVTLICGLKACASARATNAGHELHSEIVKKGLECDFFISNSLVCMYAECGLLATAMDLLCKLPLKDITAWNTLLTGYVENGCCDQGLACFKQMEHESVPLNAVSFVCTLKACSCLGDAMIGEDIHIKVVKFGFEGDLIISSAVVDMYMKCSLFAEALKAFNSLTSHDVVSWTVLIMGYVHNGNGEAALHIFERVLCECHCVNSVTFVGSLIACGYIGALVKGREIHSMVIKKGLEGDCYVVNSLVNMYAKCGMLLEAHEVCMKLQVPDPITRTSLISGYTEHGCGEKALICLEKLQHAGVLVNVVTLGSGLKACGSLGTLDKGQQMHGEVIRKGFEGDPMIGFTLIEMYAKCAALGEAQHTFDKLAIVNLVSWNALIAGYTQNAEINHVMLCFVSMVQEGICPDSATFVNVLNSCSDTGSVDIGQLFFHILCSDYPCILTADHYTSIVDLFGRAGRIGKALAIMNDMTFHPHAVLWHIVLGACSRSRDVDIGRHAFKHAAILNEKDTVAHVLMSNLCVDTEG